MSESEVMECPKCGGEMEKGYLISDGLNLRWDHERHNFIAKGEVLEATVIKLLNFEAYRCARCKLVLFYYGRVQSSETPKCSIRECVKCGKTIPLGSKECSFCGAKQKEGVES